MSKKRKSPPCKSRLDNLERKLFNSIINRPCSQCQEGEVRTGHNKGKDNPMYGKIFSETHRRRISEALKGRTVSPQNCFQKGEKHWNWNGGISVHPSGVVYIYKPDHPHAWCGKYMAEHRLIAEKILGRYLKSNEIVHHINENRSDNRNCNLLICSKGYHQWLHWKIWRSKRRNM